jgi:nucleotidyltransferase/DNA polymerase involved in DNA repair
MPPAAIGHIDLDCFYVSAERVRNAFLRDKAVAVLGNQGACVIAKSYELKAKGVATGEPIWEALRKCPDSIYVKRDFRWYEVLSRKMLAVMQELSPEVEYYSIDEVFFKAEPLRGMALQETAEAIRGQILQAVGVPATVGIARSRSLAKLISDTAKPFGALAVLDPEAERHLLAQHPVTDIAGIADRRAARLAPYGIYTCLDLALADRKLVRSLLTSAGEAIWWELNGEPIQAIRVHRPRHKMLSRGGSLGEATADPLRVWAWLVRNLERLIEELEFHQVRAGRLSLYLAHQDGRDGGGEAALMSPTDRFDLLLDAARYALDKAWRKGVPVTRMHLIASQLRYPGAFQPGLFDTPPARAAALARVKREINARFGRFTLRSAATLPLADVYRDDASNYDICDVRRKICF